MFFQIKPNKKEIENKTIRFPIPLIENIGKAIIGKGITFSRFVIQVCENTLNNIEHLCFLWYFLRGFPSTFFQMV